MAIIPRFLVPRFLRSTENKFWFDPINPARHLTAGRQRRIAIIRVLDRTGFDWHIYFVAASGFFTDSYNLFATNVILPSIAYVYWPSIDADPHRRNEIAINEATLAGSMIGQLLFGYLADRYGRRKLYGIELLLVVVSTLGLTQASDGYRDGSLSSTSMSILGWLLFYRLLQGVGIGAEYPLSACITAEYASVNSRARMMAALFLMQPLGQLLAVVVGLCVAVGYNNSMNFEESSTEPDAVERTNLIVDSIWRWVIGVGAIPALIAIWCRLTIPESPRYTLDVIEDADMALMDLQSYRQDHQGLDDLESEPSAPERDTEDDASFHLDRPFDPGWVATPDQSLHRQPRDQSSNLKPGFWHGFRLYLFDEGNWRRLLGTSLCWFLLDFAYFGLGINNPRTLAKIWASESQQGAAQFSWNTGLVNGMSFLSNDHNNIFHVLKHSALRSIVTSCIGGLSGSIVLIKVIPYVSRRRLLYWTFVALAVLLLLIGSTMFRVFETKYHALTITLYVLSQVIFNFGPNSLLFIVPAEIFPTRYRATCYGISAASGKLSSVIVQSFLPFVAHTITPESSAFNDCTGLAVMMMVFSGLMLVGGFVAWLWVPEVQGRCEESEDGFERPSKTLEELAGGWKSEETERRERHRRRRSWLQKLA